MNEQQVNAIKAAVTESAEMTAAKNAGQWKSLAGMLNTPSVTVPNPGTRIAELGILDALGPVAGEAFLQGIEGAANTNPVLARIVRWLRTEHGVDLGNAALQGQLLALVQAGVITSDSANSLIARGSQQVGKSASLIGRDITPTELRDEVYSAE